MKSLSAASNLNNYIIEPVKKCLDKTLASYRYYDIGKEDELTTNNSGVDIIAHQLELQFEGNDPLFISWATISGWHQYSLCVSENSFCSDVDTYTKTDDNWTEVVGKRLKGFDVYGYKENVITTTVTATGKKTKDIYHYEPHLLVLHFENDKVLGIANFYFDKNFEPSLPMGDDVWIIFNWNYLDTYIKILSLESLDV
jgi:hypothetical protein